MKKTVEFLRSEAFVFLTLLAVITSQVVHTMHLFETVRVFDLSFEVNGERITAPNWAHAFVFAIAIESAILMFILNGKRLPSKIYAIGSLLTNLLYYKAWTLPLSGMAASVLISSMLAGSIWFFSDLFAEKVDAPRMKAKTSDEEDNLKDLLAEETRKITFKTTMPANAR
jgi:Na+-transporting methylmalonyl-CoA/oxaloacetate decarboxylase gamma subunit